MLALYLVVCVVGLFGLARCSDLFVAGASSLASRLGVSALVVGAVVVGFGTSAPELLVSVLAAAGGSPDVGLGNVIGSNLANLTLVLGVAALFGSVVVSSNVLRKELPLALGAMLLFGVVVQGGLTRLEGAVLLAALVGAVLLVIRSSRSVPLPDGLGDDVEEFLAPGADVPLRRGVLRTLVGLAGTLVSAQALVWAALGIATSAGLSGGFVGLTIVAVGTSLPELMTAVQAARRGESDLVVGNLLGSNMFNSLAVGGAVALVAPHSGGEWNLLVLGVGLMLGLGLLAAYLMRTGHRLTRPEAVLLLLAYAGAVPLLA